ncbi:protein phosphatase 1G-like [Amphiura filiformis]|uniref:protein phosphatase 1G-like n=1 Tax=Amphiura filiformis TaxID=82378 RepID=UPI003B20BB22
MGAYLSEPNLEKVSEDGGAENLSYGACAMQGWRLAQEDAHNCILKLDEETSMFAVYDGHGGSEVAAYCSQHLPECIRNQTAYKEGKLRKALENAFMEFDATLKETSVISELKQIAGLDKLSDSADEDEAEALQEEANLPLNDLLAKYQYEPSKTRSLRQKLDRNDLLSPMVRKKPPTFPNEDLGEEDGILKDKAECLSSSSSSSSANGDVESRTEAKGSHDGSADKKVPRRVATQVLKANGDSNGKEVKKEEEGGGEGDGVVNEKGDAKKKSGATCNGDAVITKEEEDKKTGETKTEEKSQKVDGETKATDEEEEADDDDEEFDEDDSDDEDVDEEDYEDEEEEDEEEEEEEGPFLQTGEKEEPGSDSGCTAVVALLRNKHLIVANAGDSRCVLSRGGQAMDLSFDHKPEDEVEFNRIEKAGGKVTPDGRVNGGLNLSRAIGDHCYKLNADLPPEEQMISAFPDIETTSLQDMDQFMVIACDGIWNVMSSQEVIDFVLERIGQENEKGETYQLSAICQELFDACLAPDTSGDGTGCDNMTCIVIQFHFDTNQVTVGAKRKSLDEKDGEKKEESASKRSKQDD